jgi:hypothetical protein
MLTPHLSLSCAGTSLVDAFSGRSILELSWQEEYHSFGFLWVPGKLVRWDLDYEPVFEVNQDILDKKVSSDTLVTPGSAGSYNVSDRTDHCSQW